MRYQFRAPWDWLLRGITGGVILLFAVLNYATPNLFVAILLWSIVLGCAAFGVYGYSIQDGKLKILRLGWSTDISLSEISNIENKPNAMMGSLRRFGIGGLFGYIGNFSNSILGRYKAYATHTKRTVVLDVGTEQIVISPDDPAAFIEAVVETQK
ncbi:PH domain-containing protein [Gracilimonas sp.]|uniref:PH domain-containing protein n=1 Tax=Gracilimonas sp. TaxID=1974203 RepID=UPI0028726F7C|nr:PH domain-containing protein [Gracilimonas sp.]